MAGGIILECLILALSTMVRDGFKIRVSYLKLSPPWWSEHHFRVSYNEALSPHGGVSIILECLILSSLHHGGVSFKIRVSYNEALSPHGESGIILRVSYLKRSPPWWVSVHFKSVLS